MTNIVNRHQTPEEPWEPIIFYIPAPTENEPSSTSHEDGLWNPVTFYTPLPSQAEMSPALNTRDSDTLIAEKPSEAVEDFVPPFCTEVKSQELLPLQRKPQQSPSTAQPTTTIPAPTTALVPTQPKVPAATDQPRTEQAEEKRQTLKPYDIAIELMNSLPLRLVENALYYFDGKIFRFVSAEAMHRIIMGKCRKYVAIIGNDTFIKQIYEVI